ncbi:MAG: hypothetical protein AAF357_14425 [Verrucomicrobiota bacterium]
MDLTEFAAKLEKWDQEQVKVCFAKRILAIDEAIAEVCAVFDETRAVPYTDALLGATAQVHRLTLIARNAKDFDGTNVTVINPWEFQ